MSEIKHAKDDSYTDQNNYSVMKIAEAILKDGGTATK